MSWAIQTRVHDRQGGHRVHINARSLALESIYDVTMTGGPGVRTLGTDASMRREMNAFGPPIEGDFDFDEGVEPAEVILEWSDGGALCQETIALTTRHGIAESTTGDVGRPHTHGGLRTLLRKHPTLAWRLHR